MTRPDRRPRLLLIDDEPAALGDLVHCLRDEFELTHALDGRTGLQQARALRPDLILLDVVMPGTDGHAACRLLKADTTTRDIPVIFLTGLQAPEERLRGFSLGAVDYVGKPFHPAEVRARVGVHLRLAAGLNPRLERQLDRRLARRLASASTPGAVAGAAPVPAPLGPDASAGEQVRAAMAYITQHLAALPTIAQIAQHIGADEVRLLTLFRQELGLSVSGYIAEERVRAGCRLLAHTDLSLAEIAGEIGYSAVGNFISAFRDRMGVAPQAWREAAQAGGPQPLAMRQDDEDEPCPGGIGLRETCAKADGPAGLA